MDDLRIGVGRFHPVFSGEFRLDGGDQNFSVITGLGRKSLVMTAS